MSEHDLIIRSGLVVDGNGGEPFAGDVAVEDGLIAAVGQVSGAGQRRRSTPTGQIVAPGFVDIHTHYDGQATWDSRLQPSSWHGVTTVVMGNCGVGFAPVPAAKPGPPGRADGGRRGHSRHGAARRPDLGLGVVRDYLGVLAERRYDVDVAAQVPHAALRVEVMGQRGGTGCRRRRTRSAEIARARRGGDDSRARSASRPRGR